MSQVKNGKVIRKRLAQLVTALFFGAAALVVGGLWIVPRVTSIETLTVYTGSMDPTIPEGSVVFMRPVDPDSLEVGDIITFHPPSGGNTLVTHRLSEVTTDDDGLTAFRTKGDNNRTADTWLIPGRAVVGEVLLDVPYLGHLANRSSSKAGSMLIVGIPLALFAGMNIHTLYTELRSGRRRRDDDSDPLALDFSEATEPHADIEEQRDAHGAEEQAESDEPNSGRRVVIDA